MTARGELRALTGARFVAALHVVVYHALRPVVVDDANPASRFVVAGGSAVTFFFVLSGFVLTYAYAGGAAPLLRTTPRPRGEPEESSATRVFWRARFARIAPVYWLALLLVLPIGAIARAKGLVTDPLGPVSFALVATGLQAWVPQAALRWNPPAWSLSCELFFYAAFPLVAPFIARARRAPVLVVVALCWAAAVAVTVVAVVVAPAIAAVPPGSDDVGANVLRFSPLLRLPEFLVGMLAGRLFLDGARLPWLAGAAAFAAAVVVAASGVVPYLVVHDALLAPLFAAGILALANGEGPLARVLASPPLHVLGNASYALYLLHVPFMIWTAALLKTKELSSTAALAAGLAAIPASVVVYFAVERPARERLRSSTRGHAPG